MPKLSAAVLLSLLNWGAGIASLVWIGLVGGIGLHFKTSFPLWFNDYSVSELLWHEELMFGPVAVLWSIVLGIRYAVRRRFAMSIPVTRDAWRFWTQPHIWIIAALWLTWPAVMEIPGLLSTLGLDAERAGPLPHALFSVIFVTPPLLLSVLFVAWERGRLRAR